MAPPPASTFLARVTVLLSNVPVLDLKDTWAHGTLVGPALIATTTQNLERLRQGTEGEPSIWAFGEVAFGADPPLGVEVQRDDASGIVLVWLAALSQTAPSLDTLTSPLPDVNFMFELLQLEPPGTPSPYPWLAQFTGFTTVDGRTRLRLHPQPEPPLPPGLEGVPLVWDERIVGIVVSDTADRSTGERELLAVPMTEIMYGPLGEEIRAHHEGHAGATQTMSDEPSIKAEPASDSSTSPLVQGEPPLPIQEDDEYPPTGITVPEVSLDGAALLSRLGGRARNALYLADVIRSRLGDPVLSTVHLIAGLYESSASDLMQRLDAAGIDERQLRQILRETGHREIFFSETYLTGDLGELPPCSRNVRFALATAYESAAADDDSQDVEARHLLTGLLSARGSAVVRALLDRGVRPPAGEATAAPRLSIPGFRPDAITDRDLLGIRNDVEALASLLAAKDVALPLSIGLFGEWGSGKSFFMEQMRTRINGFIDDAAQAARHGQATPYCTNVVQLEFNAWHYVDTVLWASLADEIFEGLAAKIDLASLPANVKDRLEYERERLTVDAARKRVELGEAELALAAQATNLQAVTLEAEAERREVDALVDAMTPTLVMHGAANVLVQQDEVQKQLKALQDRAAKQIDQAATALNLPAAELSPEAARRRLLELRGFGDAFLLAVTSPRDRRQWAWVVGVALAVIVVILLFGAIQTALADRVSLFATSLATVVGAGITLLAGIGVVLRPYVLAARRAIGLIWELRAESTRLAELEREERLKAIKQRQDDAQKGVSRAQQTVETRRKEVDDLDRRLEALRADRRLREFVKRRHDSEDYRRLRGVIGQARSDFEQLDLLLRQERSRVGTTAAQPEALPDGPLLPTLDRIVLYIDDLDRCTEEKVMEVLQAVHLLLAFPLFAVVVAVDPRWLLYSVRQHSAAFRDDRDEADDGLSDEERAHWRSTPMNYLEKVFQIPFTLRPMGSAGFGKLIEVLAAPLNTSTATNGTSDADGATAGQPDTAGQPSRAETTPAAGEGENREPTSSVDRPRVSSPGDTSDGQPAEPERRQAGDEGQAARPAAQETATHGSPPVALGTRHLEIAIHERLFMKRLHELIPSPRAAKRFVNVYRLLKAKAEPNQERFEQLTLPVVGDYRAALLLLAILTGYPEQATEILSALIKATASGRWWTFLEQFRSHAVPPSAEALDGEDLAARRQTSARWTALFEILDRYRQPTASGVEPLLPEHEPCTAFVRWAPHVARYSFQSGRVLLSG